MFKKEKVLFKGKTNLANYQIVDMVYEGRKARVLFSGDREAAFSGLPLDGENALLFDYIQRLFEMTAHIRPKRLLMIGGGVYTLPMALLRALPDIRIDVVEIDGELDQIASRFFGFKPDERLRIFHMDGKQFIEQTSQTYDMIIVDAFSRLHIPESLSGKDMALLSHKALSSKGIVALNIISAYNGRASEIIKEFENTYRAVYKNISVYPADRRLSLWSSQNYILIAEKGTSPRGHGLGYESIEKR